MAILVFNAGSSTLKFGVYSLEGQKDSEGDFEWPPDLPLAALPDLGPIRSKLRPDAIGHRIVHGGTRFQESVLINDEVKKGIRSLVELAPLHNPRALEVIEACEEAFPGKPQAAVFDTAFFSKLPLRQVVYPLPYVWYEEWGIRRFGFHGISHAYCAGRAAQLMEARRAPHRRLVICHLGRGCSATAATDGSPVATTMGFTPMDGLMMGSRPGSLDPGLLLYVERRYGVEAKRLEKLLNQESGLLGVSGISSDVRELEAAVARGHERAKLALEIFADKVRSAIGSLAVTLGGVDALVFTGGIGEHSAHLRAAACEGLQCLGLRLDPRLNAQRQPDADIASAESSGRIWIIQTREEDRIAQETSRLIGRQTAAAK